MTAELTRHEIPKPSEAWKWVLAGSIYGLLMRVLFGFLPSDSGGVMSAAFLVVTPTVVGALATYGARNRNPSFGAMIIRPCAAMLLMLAGCAVTLLEGAICLAMMMPLFLIFAIIGGVGMGIALHYAGRHSGKLPCVALLPLLMVLGEQGVPTHDRVLELKQSIVIDASPQTVWHQILTARDIVPEELPLSLTHLIGVPKPVEGVNRSTQDGEVRYSKWERGVNFRAVVTHKVQHESITWNYVFDGESFPPGSMDDHVAIGGEYFNLQDTTFKLHRLAGERTRLDIVTHHRITTSVNFYAVPVATLLGNDFISTILTLYKTRSENSNRKSKVTAAPLQHDVAPV